MPIRPSGADHHLAASLDPVTEAPFETLEADEVEGLLDYRFESLTSYGCPPASAAVIASHIEIEVFVVALLV